MRVFGPQLRYSRGEPVKQLSLQERVRQRLRDLVNKSDVPHEVLGKYLGLSRSGVTRLLNDEDHGIGFAHLEKLCEFFQVTPCELMNNPHSVVQEIKPLEAQLLKRFRERTELWRHSLLSVIEEPTNSRPAKSRRARAGRAELTERQQLVVDLFVQSDEQSQDGVLKVLRGSAKRRVAVDSDGATE